MYTSMHAHIEVRLCAHRGVHMHMYMRACIHVYLLGLFNAGPFLTSALITPFSKIGLTPIRAGVKWAASVNKFNFEICDTKTN